MIIILLTIAIILLAALGQSLFRKLRKIRERRMAEATYDTAVRLWSYAAQVRTEIDEMLRKGSGVLSYASIAVPHSPGYKFSLELEAHRFRVHALPLKYGKTARLSLFVDESLTVRASDRAGDFATVDDGEYEGLPSDQATKD